MQLSNIGIYCVVVVRKYLKMFYYCVHVVAIIVSAVLTETVSEVHVTSDVKSSRPDCPRGRNFVLGLDKLSSATSSSLGIWPRHVLRLCNLASSICVFHDKAQANDFHSTIRPMPSQYKFTIYSHLLTCFVWCLFIASDCYSFRVLSQPVYAL